MTGYMRIGVIGTQGAGKTLMLVGFGKKFHDVGVDVYSNFKVNYPHYKVESPEEIADIHDGFFIADDFGQWVDSRLSQSKQNLLITYILGHARKSHYGFAYSSQVPTQLDLRIRHILTHIFLPYPDSLNYPTKIFLEGYRLFQLDWLPLRTRIWNVAALGKYYDTDAPIYGDDTGVGQRRKLEFVGGA